MHYVYKIDKNLKKILMDKKHFVVGDVRNKKNQLKRYFGAY